MISPVAIFVYNRVDNTQQTVQALLRNTLAKETDVYVFSDGGKNEESWKRVNEVRAYLYEVKREVEANGGLRSITLVERPENIYLERNIIEGIAYVLDRHDTVIVLEDDI
ncbi:MAG: glycosyltransferase family 2 protein, partial [Bacteroidaceae bacterium]|nr:glycosyltransferase family 2 protein [Bacteroidaceae bacterium]